MQTAYIEVRAVQHLLHVAVGEQIAHRPIVERGQRVHETGVDTVRQLHEAHLLRVAVAAVRLGIDRDFGGRGQRCDGRIERGLIVHEAIGRCVCQRSGKSMLTRITHSMMRRTGGLVNRHLARLLADSYASGGCALNRFRPPVSRPITTSSTDASTSNIAIVMKAEFGNRKW